MPSNTIIRKAFSASELKDVYWISMICKSRTFPDRVQRIFSLTIHFANFQDSDLNDGIHLVIVDKTDYNGDILVGELRSAGLRQRLERTRSATRLIQRRLCSSQNKGSTTPLMVVLECTFVTRGRSTEWILHPFQPHNSTELNHPRIIFDRVYRPESGNHTLTTILTFQTDQPARVTNYSLKAADYIHLSITREYDSRPSAPSLPDETIGMIAAYVIGEHEAFTTEWCKALFSVGVINRSWLFLFYIRWVFLASGVNNVKAFHHFRSATAAIKKGLSPEITSYIRGFNIDMFSYGPQNQTQFVEFATTLIRRFDTLRYIHISADILLMAADALGEQRCVEKFKIFMQHEPFQLPLVVVRNVIQSWTRLKELNFWLDMDAWLRPEINDLIWDLEPADSGTTSFRLLEELSFTRVYLPGNQFIQILPAAPERLRRVYIHSVVGLSTRIISTFLALTHSTLAELVILESSILPTVSDSVVISYDYPLDAWVDKMKCLTLARVPGTVASVHSLWRKTNTTPNSTSSIDIECYFIPSTYRSNDWTSSENSSLLASAINKSSWNKVHIDLPFGYKPSKDVWGKAIEAAEKKGIMLNVYGDGVTMRSSVA